MFGSNSAVVLLGILIALLVAPSLTVHVQSSVLTLPGLGSLRGSLGQTAWSGQTIYEFRGIPFAESPSGRNRFKPPVEKSPWDGVKDVSEDGIHCPKIANLKKLTQDELNAGDWEDCLHLSVYSKNLEKKSPVMFYIHGGAFIFGSASDHPPNFLLEKDVVLVVAQYRLGALGFLSTKTPEIPGNVAVLDVILALEWVQKYITHFGGNPAQVTIFGQSAGAAIVSALTISPAVREGLFHRGILQSGSILSTWGYNEKPVEQATSIAKRTGCRTSSVNDINKCLRDVSLLKLLELSLNDHFTFTLGDLHNILPDKPKYLINAETRKYPLMGGVTAHDGSFQVAIIYDNSRAIFDNSNDGQLMINTVLKGVGLSDETGLESVLLTQTLFKGEQILRGNFTELIPGFIDMSSNVIIKIPTFYFLQLMAKYNPDNTYLYTFDYQGESTRFGYGNNTDHYPFNGGAHHSDDNLYIFPTMKLNQKDKQIAKLMVDLWTSFATKGVPRAAEVNKWPSLSKISGPYLHINAVPTVGTNFYDELTVTVDDLDNKILRKRSP